MKYVRYIPVKSFEAWLIGGVAIFFVVVNISICSNKTYGIYYRYVCALNTLIQHSCNKHFVAMLLILEDNRSIMGVGMRRFCRHNF